MFESLSSTDIRAISIVVATLVLGWFLIIGTINRKGRK